MLVKNLENNKINDILDCSQEWEENIVIRKLLKIKSKLVIFFYMIKNYHLLDKHSLKLISKKKTF